MAQKVITQLVDDLDDTVLGEGEGETVAFMLDGTNYEIDLSLKNADKFRGVVLDYTAKARKVGKTNSRTKKISTNGAKPAEIRAWGKNNGFDVPDRGRVPQEIVDAFNATS